MSEITSESAPALEAQCHSLIHEGTAEMMRRDTRPVKRSELRHYHHAEGQSEEFPQSQRRLRQNLERSNSEGVQERNPSEETRTANARHKLEMRNHPPESRRCEVKRRSHKHPLLTTHQENARLN